MFTIFVVVVAAAVFVMYFRNERQRPSRLREAPAQPISELPEDTPGRVVGVTQPHGEPLTAPFSGRPCVYYAVRVERLRDPDVTEPLVATEAPQGMDPADAAAGAPALLAAWLPAASETRSVAFMIQDESGRALIEPAEAKVELSGAEPVDIDLAALPPRQAEFLARHALATPGARLRYYEVIIAIGEAVAVVGSGTPEPDPDAAPANHYRGDPPSRLRLTSSANHPLFISNDW